MVSTTSPRPGTVRAGGRDSAPVIHRHLRAEILDGHLAAGVELSQAGTAARFGVSRGPVREAFRLLEREGLIDARLNHRAKVTGLSVDELEHLYAVRVLHESVALSVSVPSFTTRQLEELGALAHGLEHSETGTDTFDFDAWDEVHQRFHMLLLTHSGSRMLGSVAEWAEHTRRYRRAYAEDGRGLPRGAAEHAVLARLCRDRDAAGAARLLAVHLSRAAFTLLERMAPSHDPVLLRTAVGQVVGAAGPR